MKKIEVHIYELLFTHDCVTLPAFGGFVGQYTSSLFNKKLNSFTPPAKNVSFNKHLKNDDGLLTHDIANFQNISYTEASETIKQYILALKKELEENKRVEINKVGTLFLDKENAIKFISSTTNFSTQSYGLPTIKPQLRKIEIKKTETPVVKLISAEKENDIPIIAINSTQKNSRSNNWWVAAILFPILFYSAWIPSKTELFSNSKQFHYSDLNPFTFQKNKKYEEKVIPAVEFETTTLNNFYSQSIQRVNLDDSTYLWVNNSTTINVPTAKAETTYVEVKEVELKEEIKLATSYHLIGGCFGDEENAKNLVIQLNEIGYSARILDKNKGLFRVSVGDFTKRKSAKKAKEKLKSEQEINSWILKK